MRLPTLWILTQEVEGTTDIVLDYIHYLEGSFERIHAENVFSDIEIVISKNIALDKIVLNSQGRELTASKSTRMWHRRGDFSYRFPVSDKNLADNLNDYLQEEWEFVKRYIHENITILGGYYKEHHDNKLEDLRIARDCGLNIPESLVTTRKDKLLKFYDEHETIITKPIHNGHINFVVDDKLYLSRGVVIVNKEIIDQSASNFCLSLFQEYINKEYEIRIFFIDNELYPMAIFSQADEKTKLDFRNYNREKPNRNVPYKLPEDVKDNIKGFIRKKNLNTGSSDLIYSQNSEYIFLEVNPSGQFGWVSSNCNYYLEKKVAKYLINYQV